MISYPERGPWGKSDYKGNTSGYVIRDLLAFYQPGKLVEAFAGGRTGEEVTRSMGITNSVHLELNPKFGGWNALTDEVPEGSDLTFAHPPYHQMKTYSGPGGQWGDEAHPDDLSRCRTYEEFLSKLDLVTAKLFTSLRSGGHLAVLVGDVRKHGEFHSIQQDMLKPGKLESVIIKEQHNHSSSFKTYRGKFIPIAHEYIVIMKKNSSFIVPYSMALKGSFDMRKSSRLSWRDLAQLVLEGLGGQASLASMYPLVETTEKARNNEHWREKFRQTFTRYPKDFQPVDRKGEWALTSLHAESERGGPPSGLTLTL